MRNISLLLAVFFLNSALPAFAQYTSACGGSANHPCDCSDRYTCDAEGNCSCQGDQYCADTNCGNPNNETLKNKILGIKHSGPNSIKPTQTIALPKSTSRLDGKKLNYVAAAAGQCVSWFATGDLGTVGVTNSCNHCVIAKYSWQGLGIYNYPLAAYQSGHIDILSSYGTPAGEQPCAEK
jgi:hypothetical protein